MTSELLLISANQSGCFIFPEVWNICYVSPNGGRCGRFRVGCAKGLPSLGVEKLFSQQFEALKTFVSGTDVFLNLPTGFGKSLVFQMAPLVQAELSRGHDGFAVNPVILTNDSLKDLY